jgi:hypothetical protein
MQRNFRFLAVLTALVLAFGLGNALSSFAQVNSYTFTPGAAVAPTQGAGATVLGSGTMIDDQVYAARPIGFTFPFNGKSFSTVNISANGWLSFGAALSSTQKFFFPLAASGGDGVIAAFAADLRGTATGQISTRLVGTAPNRSFVVQYQNWTLFNAGVATTFSMTFEVILQENGVIRLNFSPTTNTAQFPSSLVQIGLRGSSTSDFAIKQNIFFGANLTSSNIVFTVNAAVIQQIHSLQGTLTPPTTSIAPATTYSISGTVRNIFGQPLNNVTISGGGRQALSQNGSFTLTGLANGTYPLTASASNLTFVANGASTATVNGANVTNVVFTAIVASISGAARLNNQGLAGVTMTLTSSNLGAPFSLATGSSGGFTIQGLPNGAYTLTPTLNGHTFTPATRTITIANGMSQTALDFTAALINPPTFGISGTVRNSQNTAVPGVSVMLSNGRNTVTDAQGNYTFANVANGAYSIVVSAPGMFFQTNRANIVVNGANITQNFTALTAQVSGTITVGGVARTGVTVQFSGGPAGLQTATSGANGLYTRSLPGGTYTATATLAGTTFTPNSAIITLTSGATLSNVNFAGTAVPSATFTVAGRVVSAIDGSGVSDVTITLPGNPARTAITNFSGNYSFTGVDPGNYAVSASATGITFAAPSQMITVSNAALSNINFTAPLGRISGRITGANGAGRAGVVITAGSSTATTNANGDYVLLNLRGGSYTLAPSLAGFAFTPQMLAVTLANGATVANQNFTAQSTAPQFSISGRVTSSANPNTGIQGVTIAAGANSTVTDAGGFYTLSNMANGMVNVTATRMGMTFTQSSQAVTINEANVSNINFVAQLANITGTITVNGVGQAGITISDGTRNATSAANGTYTISNVPAGTYTLTPNGANLTYTPATRSVTVVAGVNQTAQNFAGAVPMMQQAVFGAPTLVNPANNADIQAFTCGSPCFGFFWTLVPGAVSYRLQVASDAAFTNFRGGGLFQTSLTPNTSFFTLSQNFAPTAAGVQYFWRVQAVDANGTASAYSAANTFIARTPQTESTLGTTPINITSQFAPRTHGWNFSNSGENPNFPQFTNYVWGALYYDAVNYNLAPYSSYAAASPEWATKAQRAKPDISPIWDDFALSYARVMPIYANNNGNQTPTVNAVTSWNPSEWGGSCYGFAVTSVFHYAGLYNAQTPLFNVPVSNATRKIIHAHQDYQGFRIGTGSNTPNRTVQLIRDAIATGDRMQHPTISFQFSGPGGGGHAVVPYSIRSRVDGMGNAIADTVFIYDVNYPGALDKYFYVERATNSWRYDMAGLNANAGGSVWFGTGSAFNVGTNPRTERTINYAGRPIVRLQEDEALAPLDVATVRFTAPTIDQAQPTVEVRTPLGGSIVNTGKDPLGDDIQIPGAQPIFPLTGNLDAAMPGIQGYTIPNENLPSLFIRYTPAQAGETAEVSANDGNRFTIAGSWTASGGRSQTLVSDFENTSARFSTESAIPSWKMVMATLSPDRESWENVVRLSGAAFGENDSLNLRLVNDGAQVVVENFKTAKTFSLNFSRGIGQTFDNLRIGAGETQTFVVSNWDDLSKSGFTQLIDRDSDGKIDAENILRTPVSVRNEETSAFAVSVYPNPTASFANIEYALPKAENVRIEVVNVMGIAVMNLPETAQGLGKQRVNLDVSNLPSGTYFVRVRAGSSTVVRPLQIIR